MTVSAFKGKADIAEIHLDVLIVIAAAGEFHAIYMNQPTRSDEDVRSHRVVTS